MEYALGNMHFGIPTTIALVTQCWERAEEAVRQQWTKRSPHADEPYVTEHFWESLNGELQNATRNGALRRAFQEDLCKAFTRLRHAYIQLDKITHGLFMDCRLHGPTEERRTGGDYGLTIIQPEFEKTSSGSSIKLREHGLLCQAKIRRKTGRWGSLTKNQNLVLPPFLRFTGLVLYDYQLVDASPLDPFKWQLCENHQIQEVKSWLSADDFPDPISSAEVLKALSTGSIGTSDEHMLRKVIGSAGRRKLDIRITWRDGLPPNGMKISEASRVREVVRQYA